MTAPRYQRLPPKWLYRLHGIIAMRTLMRRRRVDDVALRCVRWALDAWTLAAHKVWQAQQDRP